MGYYTRFSLQVLDKKGRPLSVSEVNDLNIPEEFVHNPWAQWSESDPGDPYVINEGSSIKWYSFESDCCRVSGENPDLTFILDGEGEATGDIWRAVFIRGRMHFWRLDTTLPSLEEMLKIPPRG